MSLEPGTRLGPYDVMEKLGAGGMGEVYRARDRKLDRDVAIKILPDLFASDPDRLARFEREAKTLAALNHPNIAQVHGLEESPSTGSGPGATHALVMELVPGEDLSARVAQGPMALDETVAIARQIAEALEAAHDAGIIHRDLKPANIRVRDDGAVKVLDFGLAKAFGSPGSSGGSGRPIETLAASPTMTSPAMTQMGVILGTASYMAPEQARGRPIDKRVDVWAFGAVWFEMLAGRPPFPGETMTDVLAAIVSADPDWSRLPADTPAGVRRLIERCLAKDPRQRLRDIGEVRLALSDGRAIERDAAVPARPASRAGLGWMVAAVLLTLLAASLLWPRSSTPIPDRPLVQFDIPLPAGSSLRLDSRPGVVVSADGATVAFAATENGTTRLYLRRRDNPDLKLLTGTDGASDPAFSPNGKALAFAGSSGLMRMLLEGPPVPLAKMNDSRGLAWLNDDTIVFAAETVGGLSIVKAAGGEVQPLTTLDKAKGDRTHRWPSVVPGGKAVLFTVGTISSPDNYEEARIDAVTVATKERRTVLEGASFVRVTVSGYLVYAKAGGLFAVPFDADRLATTGAPVPVLQGVSTDTTTGTAHVSLAADGTLAYVPGTTSMAERRLVWVDRKGASVPLALPPGLYNDIRVSPDGTRIAVLVGPSGSGDIWVYDVRSTTFTRLTVDHVNGSPVWSPDGKRIYYVAPDPMGQKTTVLRRPSDGSREAEVVGTIGSRAYLEGIDKLEKTAYFDYYGLTVGTNNDIISLPIGGQATTMVVGGPGAAYSSSLSPDGRWMAYQLDEGVRPEIFVRDLTAGGGRWQVSTTGGEEPHWSADGREIYYRNDTRVMVSAIETHPEFRSSPPSLLFEGAYNLRADTGISYDIDRTTGRFLMIRQADEQSRDRKAMVRVVVNWFDDVRRLVAGARK